MIESKEAFRNIKSTVLDFFTQSLNFLDRKSTGDISNDSTCMNTWRGRLQNRTV